MTHRRGPIQILLCCFLLFFCQFATGNMQNKKPHEQNPWLYSLWGERSYTTQATEDRPWWVSGGERPRPAESSTGCCSLIVLSQSFWRCSTGDSKKTLFAVPCKLRKVLQYLKSFRTSCSMHWMIRNRAIMSNHPKSCHKIFCWIPGNSIFDGVLKAVHWRRAQIFPTRPGYESSHKLWVADKLARQGGSCWFYITSGWKFL